MGDPKIWLKNICTSFFRIRIYYKPAEFLFFFKILLTARMILVDLFTALYTHPKDPLPIAGWSIMYSSLILEDFADNISLFPVSDWERYRYLLIPDYSPQQKSPSFTQTSLPILVAYIKLKPNKRLLRELFNSWKK